MRHVLIAMGAFSTVLSATPAAAVTYSGTIAEGGYDRFVLAFGATGTGRYTVNYSFSTAGAFAEFVTTITQSYDFFDKQTGANTGGNNTDAISFYEAGDPIRGSFSFVVDRPYRTDNGSDIEVGSFALTEAYVDLYGGPVAVDYSISTAFAAIPEPATWALMILGFGATGSAMRRRARVSVAAVA